MTCDLLIPVQTDFAFSDLYLFPVKTDSLVDIGRALLKIFDM